MRKLMGLCGVLVVCAFLGQAAAQEASGGNGPPAGQQWQGNHATNPNWQAKRKEMELYRSQMQELRKEMQAEMLKMRSIRKEMRALHEKMREVMGGMRGTGGAGGQEGMGPGGGQEMRPEGMGPSEGQGMGPGVQGM